MAKLYFSYSTMNAGKSTVLLQASHNYGERGMKTMLFTAELDNRSKVGNISSRIGLSEKASTFNNDDTKVIFSDEWGGGGRARCRAWDPLDWGADAIYDIVDKKLIFKSHYKMPAPQLETENCVAHNGSIIPIPNRDIFVQAWYQGGISIMDFTDSSMPKEIAYFDRGPILEDILITGGYWSTYYYDGFIYGTEITRGLDVFRLTPSEYISEKEIEAASKAFPAVGDSVFNPQQQFPMAWPATFLE